MPRLKVLLNEAGEVVGTAPAVVTSSGENGPQDVSFVARPGQRVVEVTVDAGTAALDPEGLHQAIQEMDI